MGQRCRVAGSERGMSPALHACTEGAIPLAVHRSHDAQKVYDDTVRNASETTEAARGHAGATDATPSPSAICPGSATTPTDRPESGTTVLQDGYHDGHYEEDPFEHARHA